MSGAGGWRDDLARWLQPFLAGLSHPARRAMCPLYVAGLIGLGDRKSVQPMAARADGVLYDRLHHFIAAGIWDEAPLQQALLGEADRLVGGSDAVVVVVDTALPKKGNRSVGVAPQYATTLGKTANCQTLVSLALVRGEVPVAVGLALLLPETWTGDPDRMARAGVPEDLRAARTKLEIAVAEIDRLREGGVRFGCVLADAGYGCSAPFRQALSARGLRWAVGITGRNKVYPADVAMIFPVAGRGRPRQHHVPDQVSVAAETILADMTGRVVTWRHGTKGRLRARFCALRVRMADGPTQRIGAKGNQHLPGDEVWLVREERGSGERKFYLSNLPTDATLKQLAAMIKARGICEQAHQQTKEELGLDHFEGRSWTGLHRHALMTMMAYAFLQSRRLAAAERKKKKRLPTAPALDAGDPAGHPGSPQPATATAMSAL
jgi:SRSO17 transposase